MADDEEDTMYEQPLALLPGQRARVWTQIPDLGPSDHVYENPDVTRGTQGEASMSVSTERNIQTIQAIVHDPSPSVEIYANVRGGHTVRFAQDEKSRPKNQ